MRKSEYDLLASAIMLLISALRYFGSNASTWDLEVVAQRAINMMIAMNMIIVIGNWKVLTSFLVPRAAIRLVGISIKNPASTAHSG